MCLPFKFLKIGIYVSGFLIMIYTVYYLCFASWITMFLLNRDLSGYLSGFFGLLIIFFWGLCVMVGSMVYCAIKGAKTENKNLLYKLIVGCFFHLIINIVILALTTEFLEISILSIINIITFVIIIIITSCFIKHPKDKKKNEKIRSLIYDQDAYDQYLAQQKI